MKLLLMLNVLHALEQMRHREQWSRSQIMAHQTEALRRQRDYAYTHSPFYQKFHKGLIDRPLQALPVLTKSMVMEHFDEIVTDRSIRLDAVRAHAQNDNQGTRFLDRYWITATSGSSGQPGFFLYDDAEWRTILASFARGQEWSGTKLSLTRRRKMASVASISAWHMSSQVAATARSWWMPALRLAASDPLPDIVARLNDWQPDMLIAYASMARILAEEQADGRLDIHPEVIFTSSEVLTEETRRRAEAVWGRTPFNQYGATETANIAAECREGRRLHLYEDLVIVEVVDEHYQPVPTGEYGARVLVTPLFTRTQPLIRYEINDSVRLTHEPCPSCKRTFAVLEGIEGRVEDTLYLPSVAGDQIAIRPLVFNRIMDVLPVSGWQVVQESGNRLTVLLAGSSDSLTDELLIQRLSQALAEHGASVPDIQIQHVQAVPKTAAGKAPLIKAHRVVSESAPRAEMPAAE